MQKVSKQIQAFRKVDGFLDEGKRDIVLKAIYGTVTEHAEQYVIADQTEKNPLKEVEDIRNEMEWTEAGSVLECNGDSYKLIETSTIVTHRQDVIDGITEETSKVECFYILEMPS